MSNCTDLSVGQLTVVWPILFRNYFLAISITLVTYFRAKDATLVQIPTAICSLATLTIFIHMNSGPHWIAPAVH